MCQKRHSADVRDREGNAHTRPGEGRSEGGHWRPWASASARGRLANGDQEKREGRRRLMSEALAVNGGPRGLVLLSTLRLPG